MRKCLLLVLEVRVVLYFVADIFYPSSVWELGFASFGIKQNNWVLDLPYYACADTANSEALFDVHKKVIASLQCVTRISDCFTHHASIPAPLVPEDSL